MTSLLGENGRSASLSSSPATTRNPPVNSSSNSTPLRSTFVASCPMTSSSSVGVSNVNVISSSPDVHNVCAVPPTLSCANGLLMRTKLTRINLAEGGTKYVRLNVGGRFFLTTVDTLTSRESMFSAMMSGRMELVTDEEGWILIDRDGTHFEQILNFFRDGTLNVDVFSDKDLKAILAEANFYSIDSLVSILQLAIEERTSQHFRGFSPKEVKLVPFICTKHMVDESSLFETGKAAVKFLCNRQNNKYSYTNQSDENLLKNIELFDKLAVLYQGRLNFFKDIFGFSSNEICQWTFYNKTGQKRAEVCCSSIVYATEKKNIKIDFPEAKVQEELIFLIADEFHSEPIANDVIRAMRCKHSTSAMP